MVNSEQVEALRMQPVPQPVPQPAIPLLNQEPDATDADAAASQDDYDPHKHRQLDKPTNNMETLVHLVKCSLGTGILAMPQAFRRAGVIPGLLGTVLLAGVITHSLHMLVRAQYWACKKALVPQMSYPETMSACLRAGPAPAQRCARVAAGAVDCFIVFYQLGICCVYIVFIADNVKQLVDPVYKVHVVGHMCALVVPLLGLNMIRDLKLLAPFSAVANLLTLVGLGIIVYYLATEPTRRGTGIDLWGSLHTFPLFFGTVLFALTAVGVVVALESNMKTPQAFSAPCGVLNSGMAFITALYIAVGLAGYLYCGSTCSDSITLDLPMERDTLAMSATVMMVIAIFISYGLHCYVPVDVMWKGYLRPWLLKRGDARLLLWEYVLRAATCLCTFVVAASVPRLGLFISLCGALCLSALGICFPAVMDACSARAPAPGTPTPGAPAPGAPAPAAPRMRLCKDALLFLVGIAGLVIGTYTSLVAIIHSYM